MEIDFRETPAGDHASRALEAIGDLGTKEVLSLLFDEDPSDVADSIRNVLGESVDIQKMRWGTKDLAWVLHVKRSLKPSSYHPE